MKRHITELEKRLLEKDFILTYKTYMGKHSKKTEYYVYEGEVCTCKCEKYDIERYVKVKILLNSKRTNIVDFKMELNAPEYVDLIWYVFFQDTFKKINKFIHDLGQPEETTDTETKELDDSEVNE